MNCDVCKSELSVCKFGNDEIIYCKKCHLIWISKKMINQIGNCLNMKDIFINPIDYKGEHVVVNEEDRECPKCGSKTDKMMFGDIIIDRCLKCDYVCFDNGELVRYLGYFVDTNDESKDSVVFINSVLKKLKEMDTEVQDKNKKEEKENLNMVNFQKDKQYEKRVPKISGFAAIAGILFLGLILLAFTALISIMISSFIIAITAPVFVILLIFVMSGFVLIKPKEAKVYTLFGNYYGTLREEGFFWVNPLAQSVSGFGTISLKTRTLDNGRQKINDELGNPVEIGIIVTWEVLDTAKAIFNVDNYQVYLSAQCDSALRSIARKYPYDSSEDSDKISLKGDSDVISQELQTEIQKNVVIAGIKIISARISHLAYAPEIAIAMLQRQQAMAVIDAKKAIVDGAVGLVESTIEQLESKGIKIDDPKERAKFVNNLLIVLCANKDVQPVISGDL